MHTIWVIRHGKSAAGRPRQSDFDRPLNGRGERNGAAMQQWFAKQTNAASWVWTSPSARAMATANYVASGFGAEIIEEPSLYLAGTETLVDCLQSTPPDVGHVAIVAHNPGLTYLVNLLGKCDVTDNLVTFGTARFAYEGDWIRLQLGDADFIDLHTPKTI